VGRRLREIAAHIQRVDGLVNEVATASQEQTRGVEQMCKVIADLDQVTQRNAAGAEESATAATALRGQANVWKTSVAELLALVERPPTAPRATEPSPGLPVRADRRTAPSATIDGRRRAAPVFTSPPD
jgi:hypothetical protein